MFEPSVRISQQRQLLQDLREVDLAVRVVVRPGEPAAAVRNPSRRTRLSYRSRTNANRPSYGVLPCTSTSSCDDRRFRPRCASVTAPARETRSTTSATRRRTRATHFFPSSSLICLLLSASSVSSFSSSAAYRAGSMPVLSSFSASTRRSSVAPLVVAARAASDRPAAARRTAAVPSDEDRGDAAVLAVRPGIGAALLVAAVVEQRMLGQHDPLLLVGARHAELRRVERLEHRDPAVLVGVGRVARQRVDELAAEERREAFRAGPRRGHDRPARARQLGHERPARARGVDEHDVLRRQALQQRREVRGRHVRPRQVELRDLAVERAVPDQHDEHHVVLFRALRERRERARRSPPSSTSPSRASRPAPAARRDRRCGRAGRRAGPTRVSTSVAAHRWNSSRCSGSPASPTITARCASCAATGAAASAATNSNAQNESLITDLIDYDPRIPASPNPRARIPSPESSPSVYASPTARR